MKDRVMDEHEILAVLRNTDPFEILDTDILMRLAQKTEVRLYAVNEYVFRQGEQSRDRLFVVASGLVEVIVSNDREMEAVIGLRRRYDFLGETVLLSQQQYPGSARVKEDLVCLEIGRKPFEKLLYTHAGFSGFFSALLSERMRLLYGEIAAERSYEAYSGAESPLFGKRVSEIMSYPVVTCSTKDAITTVSMTMAEKDISAVVVLDASKKPCGIVTESVLVKYLIAKGLYPVATCRVEQVINSHLVTIEAESFIGQALISMIRNKTRYLIVMERGRLVGIIAMVDLIKLRSTGQMLLTHNIEAQQSIQGLLTISREVDRILGDLVAEKADIGEILNVMSELHERLSQRIVALSEERMKREGWGPAPVDYCWINLGSAARYEQSIRTDQDSALVYADPSPDKRSAVDDYFQKLSEVIVDGLNACGFPQCTAGISPIHEKWRRSQSDWLQLIEKWSQTFLPEESRMMAILLDSRPIWGNKSLFQRIADSMFGAFQKAIHGSHESSGGQSPYRIPVSFLGTIITERSGVHKDEINLKNSGILTLVNCIRILAVHSRIREPSTLGRLEALAAGGSITPEDMNLYRSSFEALMMLTLEENLQKIRRGRAPDNYLDPYALRKRERIILKDALSGVSRLQKYVSRTVSGDWLRDML